MSIEAMKQALERAMEVLELGDAADPITVGETIDALRAAIEQAEKQESWALREALFADGEAIAHREPEKQKPVAWVCEIVEADFEQDTVTLKMLTQTYVVRAGKHWLSTEPPQSEWQGLTDEERLACEQSAKGNYVALVRAVETKLKEKNT